MKITIRDNTAATHRLLVLAPQHDDIDALANQGELVELQQSPEIAAVLSIDALIGEVTTQELSDALQDGKYTILLLVTHGDNKNIQLSSRLVTSETLARFLAPHRIELLIAMTCTSDELVQKMLEAGVPYVIGVTDWYDANCIPHQLDNNIARRYTREFFREYARAGNVKRAHDYACSRLPAREAATITLHTRVDPPDPLLDIYTRLDRIEAAIKELKSVVVTMDRGRSKQITNLAAAIFQLASAMTRPADLETAEK